ncbi:MAG: hypothetical protein RBS24_05615 [Bacilli bacterium]|nr:hypothetical protein [Bacilli bacterium]
MINFYRFEYYHTVFMTYEGIYGSTDRWRCKDHTIDYGCPGPNEDYRLRNNIQKSGKSLSKYNFGFTSIDALRSWFWDVEIYRIMSKRVHGDIFPSSRLKPCLSVYKVPEEKVLNGRYQSVILNEILKDSPVTRYTTLSWVSRILNLKVSPDNKQADDFYKREKGNRYGY